MEDSIIENQFKGKQYDYRIIIEAVGLYYHLWKKRNKRRSLSRFWQIDETYVTVKGKYRDMYRAIDFNGNTLDMWLRKHRNKVSAKAFIKRLFRDYGQPRSIVTDKYAPSLKAIKESKYLNNILEQAHRQLKCKLYYGNSFHSTYTEATMIKGIEVV